MRTSKIHNIRNYEYDFVAGKVNSFSFLLKLIIVFDENEENWYNHFSIEIGWFLWNVGVILKKIK